MLGLDLALVISSVPSIWYTNCWSKKRWHFRVELIVLCLFAPPTRLLAANPITIAGFESHGPNPGQNLLKFAQKWYFPDSQITAKLRTCLRIFMGCLRGKYGVSTPTGYFTGFLRLKTWFSGPWTIQVPKWHKMLNKFVRSFEKSYKSISQVPFRPENGPSKPEEY